MFIPGLENNPLTLVELLRSRAQTEPERVAYTFLSDGETAEARLTYAQLDQQARAVSALLTPLIAQGDRVLLLYPPGLEFIVAFFGCLYAGAVAVPAYPPRRNRNLLRLQAIVADAQASVALTTTPILGRVAPHFAQNPYLEPLRWLATDNLSTAESDYAELALAGDTLAFLQYTSGSTGLPKGVMLSHANLLHNAALVHHACAHGPDDRYVSWLPTFHDMGFMAGVLQPLYGNLPVYLMSPASFLQRPLTWLEAISRYRATTSGGPNFAYELCVRKITREQMSSLDLSTWTVAFNGAEPIRPETLERFAETFAACGFRRESLYPCYGLAEATLMVSGSRKTEVPKIKSVSSHALELNLVVEANDEESQALVGCGQTMLEQEIVIVDPETLTSCATERVGEIWVAGLSVAQGYWNKLEETEQTFNARLADSGAGPYLRTGDLGFLQAGELFVTGRLKDLIIIRGLNHYPQDIELTVEKCHAGLRAGCSAAFAFEAAGEERLAIVQEVDQHLEGDLTPLIEKIREVVVEEHDVQPHAVLLIKAGSIPKTSSGKIQRHACRNGLLQRSLEVVAEWRAEIVAPVEVVSPIDGDKIEEWLIEQLAARLGLPATEITTDQPLSRFGLDSLAVVELQHTLETALGVSVPLALLLQTPTLAQLAIKVRELRSQVRHQPVAVETAEAVEYPLSRGQQAIWFLHQVDPESAAYNIASAAIVKGEVDVAALRRSFQVLVDRHPQLRTSFHATADGPRQRTHAAEVVFSVHDTSDEQTLSREAYRPFDLTQPSLLRIHLFKRSEIEHVLLLAVHHIVADFWSLAVLLQELSIVYQAERAGEPAQLKHASLRYTDYVRWQEELISSADGERHWSYWQQRLSGNLPVLELPYVRTRPHVQTSRGGSHSFKLDADVTAKLKELGREHGATLHMTLLAVFQSLLHRYTGQRDIVVGSPTSGRGWAELAGQIGYFINPVALRTEVDGELTFTDLLARTRQTSLEALEHQDFPFATLVERLQPERDLGRAPLFQVMFVLQQAHLLKDEGLAAFALGEAGARLQLGELELESLGLAERVAQFDLTLMAAETSGQVSCSLQYKADLFDAATIERMSAHFETLVGAIVAGSSARLSELRLLTSEEEIELSGQLDQVVDGPNIVERFEQQVELAPAALAVSDGSVELNYRELNERANRLARHLRGLGVGAEQLVGVLLERSAGMVVSQLAALKAGGAYLSLDPEYPVERLRYMIADANVKVLITQKQLREQLGELSVPVLLLEDDAWRDENTCNLDAAVTLEQLAYVIYTSGSTGRPKGVQVSHGGLQNLVQWHLKDFAITAADHASHVAGLGFDAAVWELWPYLATGASVSLVSEAVRAVPASLQAWLQQQRITVSFLPTPLAESVLQLEWNDPTDLRLLLTGGDLLHHHPRIGLPFALINNYGPTENTVVATSGSVIPGEMGQPAIGGPISGAQVYVLDSYGQLAPRGVAGELYVGGASLARGYLGRAALTAERFVPDQFSGVAGARLYRTGDRVRWRESGELEFLGRLDQQVKVRGHRIELGEIEKVLQQQPGISEAVVQAVGAESEKRLVAYVVGAVEKEPLRTALRRELPEYMIPAQFVTLESLPLTANGKLDRAALPEPEALVSASGRGPKDPLEELLVRLWAEVLGRETVNVEENFFELGGHSLLATQVVSRIQETFRVTLPVRALFEAPTVETLARKVAEAKGAEVLTAPPLRRVERETAELPLSFAQQRLWFLQQLDGESAAYNMPVRVKLRGSLDVGALRRTLSEVMRRHEVLRTRFEVVEGEARQVIAAAVELELPVTDLSSMPNAEAEAERIEKAEAKQPFDLSVDLMVRTQLLRLSAEEHVLLLTMHHIVSDGWSMGVLVREVAALYEAYRKGEESPLAELAVQYGDYAVWQREWLQTEVLAGQLGYWREQLAGAPSLLELPTDGPRPAVQSFRGAAARHRLSSELHSGLQQFSRKQQATLFMTLLAGWQTLLYRYSGQTEIVVGTPIANRTRVETEELIGFFVNMLPLRAHLEPEQTFAELLAQVRERTLGAYQHQDVPFERLVEELGVGRSLSHAPVFQVMLALQNAPRPELQLSGLQLQAEGIEAETARYDLTLEAEEDEGGLSLRLEYNADLFTAATAARLLNHFEQLLKEVVASEGRETVAELELLSATERDQLVQEFNDTIVAYDTSTNIVALIEQQAAETPAALAVSDGAVELSYRELNERANRLAQILQELSVGPEQTVGVLLGRTPGMIISQLAAMKAGGAYLPLDHEYPAERLRYMLTDANVKVLITHKHLREALGELPVPVLLWDELDWTIEGNRNLNTSILPENIAYVIYTSGSTGRPKGVQVTHRGLLNLVQWHVDVCEVTAADRASHVAGLGFDASMVEVWPYLTAGGSVHLVAEEKRIEPAELQAWFLERQITVAFLPTPLTEIAVGLDWPVYAPLRVLISGGDQLRQPPPANLPFVILNDYGPTENTCVSTAQFVPSVEYTQLKPGIGRAITGTQAYVLDSYGQLAPRGVSGELYVGGASLARGYLGRAALTAERFVPDQFSGVAGARLYRTGDRVRWRESGELEFLGRLDQQVKVRGHRIELGEIEKVLQQQPGISEAVVQAVGAESEKRLVAYVVGAVEKEQLRTALRKQLPEYMIPAQFVTLESLPLTANGKLDRAALPEPEALVSASGRGPKDPLEELLVRLWAEVLGRETVGVEENFFELGGHSLLATQVVSRIQETFRVTLPVRALFEAPTVETLARKVVEAQGIEELTAPPLRRVERETAELPLSFAQQRLWFLQQLDGESAAYNMPVRVKLSGSLDVEALRRTLSEVMRRHEVLRTRFEVVEGEARQVIAEAVELELPVTDLSSMPNAEAGAERIEKAEAKQPFDLSVDLMVRMQLLRLSAEEHVLLLTMHHIVSDGWSMGVLVREVAALYEAYRKGEESPLAELAVQYGDYAVWQREWLQTEVLAGQLGYWREQLAGAPSLLELPTDGPRPAVQSFRGAAARHRLSSELHSGLQQFSRKQQATLFMTLLAGWQTLLYRYSGQTEIVVGTPIANRTRVETEELIGFFVNMLPLRAHLEPEQTFAELLAQVRERTLGAYQHQDVPFERLVEELGVGRSLSHAPVFQVMLALQNAPRPELQLSGLQLQAEGIEAETARYDLTLEAEEDEGGLSLRLEYNADLFTAATAARLLNHFEQLLKEVVASEGRETVAELELLSTTERDQLIQGFNDTTVSYDTNTNIVALIEQQAAETPAALAVSDGAVELSYRELNERANRLAHHLLESGVTNESIIGLLLERNANLVVAMLAVLKTGAAYLPLDPAYPTERITFMAADARTSLVIASQGLEAKLGDTQSRILHLDDTLLTEGASDNPNINIAPANLAYIIYTSGSTGKPKGVMVQHANVVNFFAGMDERIGAGKPGVWASVTSIAFDISVLEILWSLARGFEVVVHDQPEGFIQEDDTPAEVLARPMDFSLFYFASDDSSTNGNKYRLLLEGAKLADQFGFKAVWTPERHFHAFGGLYPNPSITGAAVAAITERVQIRAGSVVLPLHNPIRVAEEWSMIDNISNGRVGLSFASGWHANDFVFAPENYADRHEVMFRAIDTLRDLWRGNAIEAINGAGAGIQVQILPRPVQAELPVWVTAAGSPETFKRAGAIGANLLTHLLGQSIEELAEKIAIYRKAWRDSGHAGEGHVSLMLHTFIGDDGEIVREKVRQPFIKYLMSSVGLARTMLKSAGHDIDPSQFSEADFEALLSQSFDRFYEGSGLLGTPQTTLKMVNRLKAIGVNEVACLIDFGVNADDVLASLQYLNQLKERSNEKPDAKARPLTLPELMKQRAVTHLQATPSMASMLLNDATALEALAPLQKLLLGGEELPPSLATQLQSHLTGELHNMYGPTETTVWSATHRVAQFNGSIPIGKPIANTQIYILDQRFEPVPAGVAGELFIGGNGVVRGYLERRSLTAEKFLPDPFSSEPGARLYRTGDLARFRADGVIEFLGRLDHQVKVRGYRIELGEIEAVLARHQDIAENVVVAREDGQGDKRLVAYFVNAGEKTITVNDLRGYLRERLPEYMIPAAFIALPSLPLTPNGKLNRLALPAPENLRPELEVEYVPPRTEPEQIIARIWQEVLHVEKPGVNDNFFDLGGNSLLLVRVHSKLREAFGKDISLIEMFRYPTITLLVKLVANEEDKKAALKQAQDRAGKQLQARRNQRRARELVTA